MAASVLLAVVAAAAFAPGLGTPVHEFVGMVPSSPTNDAPPVLWIDFEYDTTTSSVDGVTWSLVNGDEPAVAAWDGIDLAEGGGSQSSHGCKYFDEKLYVQMGSSGLFPNTNGIIRVYEADGTYTDLDLTPAMELATEGTPYTLETHHQLEIYREVDGGPVLAMSLVRFTNDDGATVDGAFVFDTDNLVAVPTVDGHLYWAQTDAGTKSTNFEDTIYSVQYDEVTNTQWHGNGIHRFQAADGTTLLAVTSRTNAEALVYKDPWSHSAEAGGGEILQRFGSPQHANAAGQTSKHQFGLAPEDASFNVIHNIHYTRSTETAALKGKETLTIFVNLMDGEDVSVVYEFALKLTPEDETTTPQDSVFATDYVSARCSFFVPGYGGARVLGDGVYVVVSGSGRVTPATDIAFYELVDLSGATRRLEYPGPLDTGFFDPFTVVPGVTGDGNPTTAPTPGPTEPTTAPMINPTAAPTLEPTRRRDRQNNRPTRRPRNGQ